MSKTEARWRKINAFVASGLFKVATRTEVSDSFEHYFF